MLNDKIGIQPPVHTAFSSPAPGAEALKVGNASYAALVKHVAGNIDSTFQKILLENNAPREWSPLHGTTLIMAAALIAAQEALNRHGVKLTPGASFPNNINALVMASARMAAQCKTALDKKYQLTGEIDEIDVQLEELMRTQAQLSGGKTAFHRIEPAQRWRMCLDANKISFIEKHLSGGRDNPLLPFLFDNESSYLSGMMRGWRVSMESLKEPFDSNRVVDLYMGCFKSGAVPPVDTYSRAVCFSLKRGHNLTAQGQKQLFAFVAELSEYLPDYALIDSHNRVLKVSDLKGNASGIEHHQEYTLYRPELGVKDMKRAIQYCIDNFHQRCKADVKGKHLTRHITELCQRLEQLHPFPDGNCRTFGVLLLNHLLERHGLPMTMLGDPNILDGWSLDEVLKEVTKGQARVDKWTCVTPTAQRGRLAQKASALQRRLASLF